jgi:1-acyl-sn-glycerol-3-phosphate acyltransferase
MSLIYRIFGLQDILTIFSRTIPAKGWCRANQLLLEALGISVTSKITDFPQKGAVLVFANHPSGLDPYILSSVFGRDDVFFISDIYQTKKGEQVAKHIIPVFDNWLEFRKRPFLSWFGFWWMRLVAGSVTKQQASSLNSQAIATAVSRLKAGHVVLIFPSGGDSLNRPWKPGIGKIILELEKGRVPFALFGCTIFGIDEKRLFWHFLSTRYYFLRYPLFLTGKRIVVSLLKGEDDPYSIAQLLKAAL